MASKNLSINHLTSANWIALVIAVSATAWFLHLLLSDAAWLHPEALAGSVYVWLYPGQESFAQMLRKVFDWKAFDPNVNRVRPLNDAAEVIDAIARPYVTMLLGPQASLNISTVFTAILAPSFLFLWLRRVTHSLTISLVLTALFISTTGFLSVTVAYIHPAKRVNLVLLCAALYFAQRAEDEARPSDYIIMYWTLFASFFSDELALANFAIIGLIYWRTIVETKANLLWYLALPILFLVMTKFGLPVIYKLFGGHRGWDALADSRKFAVLLYFFTLEFQISSVIQFARTLLSTFGIATHTVLTEALALVVFVGLTGSAAIKSGGFASKVSLAAGALIVASWGATLLDWYPFPHEISYLGSFNYYYHSAIVVPALVWLAFLIKTLIPPPTTTQTALVATLVTFMAIANFVTFNAVNTLVKIIHYFPYSQQTLFGAVLDVSKLPHGAKTNVTIRSDAAGEYQKFEIALRSLFGNRWDQNGFYKTHKMLAATPIMSDAHLAHLLRSYRPWVTASTAVVHP